MRAGEFADHRWRARGLFHWHIRQNSARVKVPRTRTAASRRISAAVGGCS